MAAATDAIFDTTTSDALLFQSSQGYLSDPLALPRVREAKAQITKHFGEIVGNSQALLDTLDRVKAVAGTPATTLILGESGAGKELIARAIHRASGRRQQRMIKVNCASIPDELFESEFFRPRQRFLYWCPP